MIVLLLLAAVALGQDDDRDDEIFGGSSDRTEDEDALFGGGDNDMPSAAEIESRLAEADDTLTVGGRLWLRSNFVVPEGVEGVDEVDLSSPNILDVFVDARPNDRVRAFARGRASHDWTVVSGEIDPYTGDPIVPTSVVLDQLWLKFDVARKVFVTAGQQRVKWGAGRFWNPTDFLNQQRLDPLAVSDLRTGAPLLKLHIPFEAAGGNVYAVASLDETTAPDEIGGALRAEWIVGPVAEASLTAAVRKDQPLRLGTDLSAGIAVVDFRIEAAMTHGVTEPTWAGPLDLSFDNYTEPRSVDRSDEWILQAVAGAEVSIKAGDEDSVSVGVEGYYNDLGYDSAKYYPWLAAQGRFVPFHLGRYYAGTYVYVPAPGRWDDHTFIATWLSNLSDESHVTRLDWRAKLLTHLSVDANMALYAGKNGEFHYGYKLKGVPEDVLPFLPEELQSDPLITEGIDIRAPTVSFGLGAAVSF